MMRPPSSDGAEAVTTPWEKELAYRKWREENAHIAITIPADTAEKMRAYPRLIFFVSTLTIVVLCIVALCFYSMLRDSLGISYQESGHSRKGRRGFDHPSDALILFLPVLLFASALIVRFLFMQDIARQISRKVTRKIKCRPEFEKAVYKTVMSTPWSKYRFRWYSKGKRTARHMQRVTTEFGESRTVEFADDLSCVIIGPETWVDPKDESVLDMLVNGKDPFTPSI